MDVSPVDSAVIPAIRLDPLSAVNTSATVAAPPVGATQTDNTASIVNFSPLAQLLASTVIFQTRQTRQVPIPQQPQTTTSTNIDLNTLVKITTLFVEAFNNFQSSSADGQSNQFETAFENALLAEIQTETSGSGPSNTQSFIDSLAQLGIQFQQSASLTTPNQFTIDWPTLEAEFNANPAETSALLSNAFQALNSIAENLITSQSTLSPNETALQTNLLNNLYTQNGTAESQTQLDLALVNATDADLLTGQAATPAATTEAANITANDATNNTVNNPANNTSAAVAANVATAATQAAPVTTPSAATPVSTAAATTGSTAAAVAAAAPSTVSTPTVPVFIDPVIAAAVAAYRVNETIGKTVSDLEMAPETEVIPDIDAVTKAKPVSLDTGADSEENRDNQVARAEPVKERGLA